MDESLRTTNLGYAVPSVEQRNRVLRNTYWLLALSMVPTVLGAWLGVATGIVATMGAGMSLIVFMAGAFGFIYAIEKTKNSAAGVPGRGWASARPGRACRAAAPRRGPRTARRRRGARAMPGGWWRWRSARRHGRGQGHGGGRRAR